MHTERESRLVGVHRTALSPHAHGARTTLSVLSSLGPITRSAEAVEDNLLQMARNEAVDKGGDTVVKGASMEYGKRSYEIFKCK